LGAGRRIHGCGGIKRRLATGGKTTVAAPTANFIS